MTQLVEPSIGESSSNLTSGAIKWAKHDFVAPTTDEYLASDAGLTGAPLNAFRYDSSLSSGYDVVFVDGEAFVGGRWVGKDTNTTVSLTQESGTEKVYLGWSITTGDTVKIDKKGGFTTEEFERAMELWEFEKDGTGVIDDTSLRQLGPPPEENALKWDGYEVFVQDTEPSTSNPYIRFETR